MNLGQNKKLFINDSEVSNVKDSEMMRRKDAMERDELSRRILEKDKSGKSKLTKHNVKGVTLTEEEKLSVLPDLKVQSRMKFLEKREKEQLDKFVAVIKD
jgi:hypothetical protein